MVQIKLLDDTRLVKSTDVWGEIMTPHNNIRWLDTAQPIHLDLQLLPLTTSPLSFRPPKHIRTCVVNLPIFNSENGYAISEL